MRPSSELRIDEAILQVAETSWRKVAFVIAKVADAMSGELPRGDAALELVAKRIEMLVGDGRLLARGEIKNWRWSEIRKEG